MAVRFGSFLLASDERRLTRGDEHLHLTPKAFDLLTLLVDAAPRVVPKGERVLLYGQAVTVLRCELVEAA